MSRRSDTDRILHEIERVRVDGVANNNALGLALEKLDRILEAVRPGLGHFSAFVVAVELKPQEATMPPPDVQPPLDLPSITKRARIMVVDPKRFDGSALPRTEIQALTSDPTALPVVDGPDGTVTDPNGVELLTYSWYANTPLSPEPGTRAGGEITLRAAGMVDWVKPITYGDPGLGHFNVSVVEAEEE